MDVHQLEVFLAVMNSSSMTRAAETIHLSPGAVSIQLHNLANEVHAELFVHQGKRLVPTPAAKRLAEHARAVVSLMKQIGQEFECDVSKDMRPFQFATGVTTLIYQLGGPLRLLRSQYPDADIRVTVGVTEQIVAGLMDRRFDLGLISLPVAQEDLKIIPLFEVSMEADHTEAIKRLVESGFGYSILPMHALREPSCFFETFRIEGHRLNRSVALAMARTEYPRKLTKSIAEFLRVQLTPIENSNTGGIYPINQNSPAKALWS
jgi:DNA-binding transcriptional LysR family regulator